MSGVQSGPVPGPLDRAVDQVVRRIPDPAVDQTVHRAIHRAVEELVSEVDLAARVDELEREVVDLEAAVASRTTIGTAIGLLAERHGTTTERAWSLLTRLSNHTNRKVQEVARLLVAVADGHLEETDVVAVGEVARALPRAVAAVGLDGGTPSTRRRRRPAPRPPVPGPGAPDGAS